jgi:peptidyl-prolyl cis-trans isomerase D
MTSDIARLLRREKANEKALAEVTEQVEGLNSLEAIADKLGTTVSTQSGVAFGAPGARALDAKFVGAVAGAEENKLTGPIAGNVGVYIFNVDSRETGAFFTEDDARRRIEQALNFQLQSLTSIFEEIGEVEDNRARFF